MAMAMAKTDGATSTTYGTLEDVAAFIMMGLGAVYFLMVSNEDRGKGCGWA